MSTHIRNAQMCVCVCCACSCIYTEKGSTHFKLWGVVYDSYIDI